jgi:peptide/nickel transport system permease protein
MTLKKYILKRFSHSLFIMWLAATVIFFGLRAIPGGPAASILGTRATEAKVQTVRENLGLNRPVWVQYVEYMQGLVQFDFGQSLRTGQEVSVILAQAMPRTAAIGTVGVVAGCALAVPVGIFSATHRDQASDKTLTVLTFMSLSMPPFFLAILLMVFFSVQLGVLPVFGYTSLSEGVVPWFKSILLPGLSVGLPYAAIVMRMMRSSLLEVLDQEYMTMARAKGVPRQISFYKHALQNALMPVVTVAGINLALIVGGVVTVEVVFGIKGMGRVVVQSIINRDYTVTQGGMLVLAGGFILINLVVDIVYSVIDPRIRYGDEQQ